MVSCPLRIQVSCSHKVTQFDTIVLYDRPNTNDQIASATLTMSDNSTYSIGALYNAGNATIFPLGTTVTSKSILLTVDEVLYTSANIGLSEFQVYLNSTSCSTSSSSSVASATSTSTSAQSSASAVVDIALVATASASSYSAGQPASAAIDGVISGYPTNYSAEWASNGQGAGATLSLTWSKSYTVSSIVVGCDR